jgi:pyruvate,water dikinase
MVLSLRMGYHFTTIEAFCTQDPNKNYIRYQHKQGGASLARRIRRVKVIAEILHRMGFVNRSKSDFLQANTAHLEVHELMDILGKVGRLTLLTKQLDMALSTDAIAHWYIKEYSNRLGIPIPEGAAEELGS